MGYAMRILSRVFGKKPKTTIGDERIATALLGMLTPQLELLGFKLRLVPAKDQFVSDKCRGYLFGLSGSTLIHEGLRTANFNALDATFRLVYGDQHGTRLAILTVRDCQMEKQDVVWASEWAAKEVQAVYQSGGATSDAGFYLAATDQI
jgi:hypothetical protein